MSGTFTIRVKDLLSEEFDFGLTEDDYPIFNEKLRGFRNDAGIWQYNKVDDMEGGQIFYGLNRKILDHFFYHEIGQESPDMFRWQLNQRMREIMPYYNQMYRSETLKFDPFSTLDTTHENTTAQDTTGKNVGRTVAGNTPQVALSGNADYASSFTDANAQSEANVATKSSTHLKGSQGHTAALLMQWRRSFLNIEIAILGELGDLFFQIIDKPDSMYERNDSNVGYGYRPGAAFWPYF